MTTFYGNLLNYVVNPTENDHYGSGYGGAGAGRVLQELRTVPLLWGLTGRAHGFIESGFTLPSSGGTLSGSNINANIAAGVAVINGVRVEGTSTINVDFPVSDTSYVYLQLEYDGDGKVYRPVINIVTDTSQPSNSIFLGHVVCGASSISSALQCTTCNRLMWGVLQSNGSGGIAVTSYGSGDWRPVVSSPACSISFLRAFPGKQMVFSFDDSTVLDIDLNSTTTSWSFAFNTSSSLQYAFAIIG